MKVWFVVPQRSKFGAKNFYKHKFGLFQITLFERDEFDYPKYFHNFGYGIKKWH